MANNVLYFPYIRVPDNEWFTQVLLCWDQVGSIVPYEFMNNPEKLGPHMSELVQVGLVKQILPNEHVQAIPHFTDAFLEYVDRPDFPVKPDSIDLALTKTSRIHIEKLNKVAEGLVDRGLAKQDDYPWFTVESTVADQFMAYLAGVLSETEEFKSVPITDQEKHLADFSLPSVGHHDWRQKLNQIRPVILRDLLPVPSGGVGAEDLAKFKSDHASELRGFRLKIELFLAEIVSLPDHSLIDHRIELFKEQAQVDIDILVEKMRTSGWRKVGVGTLLAVSAGGLSIADGIITGGILTVIAAAFGLGSVVPDLVTSSKVGSGKGNYAAYAALARKQFGA